MVRPTLTWQEKYDNDLAKADRKKAIKSYYRQRKTELGYTKEMAKIDADLAYKKKKTKFEAENLIRKKYGLTPKYNKELGYAKPQWQDIKDKLGWNQPGERLKTRVISALYDKPKGNSAVRGFTKQFSQIAKSVPRQASQPVVDVRQIMQQQQIQRPQRPQRRNFFEHGSEIDVYGDEGLTFFDSQKRSNGKSTGSLFGFGE